MIFGEDGPEISDQLYHSLCSKWKQRFFECVQDELNAGIELVEMATVAVSAQGLVFPLLLV